MENDYTSALKAGQKQYRQSISKGEYPYLPVLDEMIPPEKQALSVDLGLVQIPVEFIVGTKSKGRTYLFARNFMPLAEEQSEFASKWKNLCTSHLEEGIRDPIKVYEYMNRFYVEEGHKRVSVLKYFGAVAIPGEVKRIMPDRDKVPEADLYFEFVDFYKRTKVNYLEFSREGSYQEFETLLGWDKKLPEEDDLRKLRTNFYYFRKAYETLGGNRLTITAADALLAYIRIYGYEDLKNLNQEKIKGSLSKAWDEITIMQEEKPVDMVLQSDGKEQAGLITRLLTRPKVKAVFLYRTNPEWSDWVQGHEFGRIRAQEALGNQLETETRVCADDEQVAEAIKEAAEDGANVIFATSSQMQNACVKAAIEYPKLHILLCSLNVSHKTIRTYFPRMYEAEFIAGAIAGNMCSNDKIGYICKYPVYGSIAEINAFARGVLLSNNNAKVYLEWVDDSPAIAKADELKEKGIDIILVRDHLRTTENERILYGLEQRMPDGSSRQLVTPQWKWGVYYEKILRSILSGSYDSLQLKTPRSLNYYWGMSSDVVGISFSPDLPRGARYLGELTALAISHGYCRPFYIPERDEEGRFIWENVKASMSMEEIVQMEKLEGNIIGSIPEYKALAQKARELVDVIGVAPAKK